MPDLGLGDQVEDPFGHAQAGAEDRDDPDGVGQDPARGGPERRGDLDRPGRQVGRRLVGQQGRPGIGPAAGTRPGPSACPGAPPACGGPTGETTGRPATRAPPQSNPLIVGCMRRIDLVSSDEPHRVRSEVIERYMVHHAKGRREGLPGRFREGWGPLRPRLARDIRLPYTEAGLKEIRATIPSSRNPAAMPVQFAVLASGSQGNATLVQAGGVGTLLDLGLGPRALGTTAGERRVGLGADRLGRPDPHPRRPRRRSDPGSRWRGSGSSCSATRAIAPTWRERPGFQMLELAGLVRHYDDRPVPDAERPEGRAGGAAARRRADVRVPGRGEARSRSARPVALGYLADTGSWSDVDGRDPGRGRPAGGRVQPRRRDAAPSGRSAALIARNLGDRGHLSNEQGAGLVAAVLRQSGPGAVRHVVLLHLSQQCNRPNLALEAARAAIRGAGRRASVHAARQATAHPDLLVTAGRRRSVAAAGRPRVAGRSPTPDFRFPEDPAPGPAGDDA